MIKWHDVKSNNIRRIGYDPDAGSAYVEFHKNGTVLAVWEYSGVTESQFEAWLAAESAGGFFHSFIKGKFKEEKIA